MKYLDNNGFQEQDEGGRICVIKGKDEKLWDKPRRDLQIFHVALWSGVVMTEGFSQNKLGVVIDATEKDGWEVFRVTMWID